MMTPSRRCAIQAKSVLLETIFTGAQRKRSSTFLATGEKLTWEEDPSLLNSSEAVSKLTGDKYYCISQAAEIVVGGGNSNVIARSRPAVDNADTALLQMKNESDR